MNQLPVINIVEDEDSDEELPIIPVEHEEEENIFIEPEPEKKKKVKKPLSDKQKAHLERCRVKALKVRKEKAEAKQKAKRPYKKKVVEEDTDETVEEEKEEDILVKNGDKKPTKQFTFNGDQDYLDFIIGKTYDRVKADRKAKKNRQQEDGTLTKNAKLDLLAQQRKAIRPAHSHSMFNYD